MAGSWIALQSAGTIWGIVLGALVLSILVALAISRRTAGQGTVECPECGHERKTRGGRCPDCGANNSPGEAYYHWREG